VCVCLCVCVCVFVCVCVCVCVCLCNVMGGACTAYGGEESFVQGFGGVT